MPREAAKVHIVYFSQRLLTGLVSSGSSVCCHIKHSFLLDLCAPLILRLKSDLAAGLWLSATTSSITLLTCVCTVCVQWREREAGCVDVTALWDSTQAVYCENVTPEESIITEEFTCIDVLAHAQGFSQTWFQVTSHFCNCAPLWQVCRCLSWLEWLFFYIVNLKHVVQKHFCVPNLSLCLNV